MIVLDIAMKRDMDLIRKMLLAAEGHEGGFAPEIKIDGYTQEEIGYHAVLLGEAGLAEIINYTSHSSKSPEGKIIRLTWEGHEFLDSARNNKIWNQAKDIINTLGGATIEIWTLVLAAQIKKNFGI